MSDKEATPRAEQGAACHLCPVCMAIATLRQARPEVVEHLMRAGTELLLAARALMAAVPLPSEGQDGQRSPERWGEGMQRIHVE